MKNGISKMTSFMLKMMIKGGKKVKDQLEETTQNPQKYQEELLLQLLKNSENSELGQKYHFSDIHSIKEFQDKFPITDYDFYAPYVEKMVEGREHVLTDEKVVHFNVTSGTLGVPKKIPVTESHVSTFSAFNSKYLNYLISEELTDEWANHRGFSLSEGSYETLPTGVTVGCASSLHTARMQKMIPFLKIDTMDMMYTSPIEARQPSVLGNYSRYLHARYALMSSDIAYGNVTFSSYLLEILRYIEDKWEMLVKDIETGTISSEVDMPDAVRQSVSKKLTPMPLRAKELKEIFLEGFESKPLFPYVWPNLKIFICVGGAGFKTYTDKIISRYFGKDLHILYLGLTASEGLFSVPYCLDKEDSVFVPDATFMEFIPLKNGERNTSQNIKLLHELEVGKQYELLITNVSGFFRYQMKDVIEVTGYHNATPTMKFVNRSGYAINMYAEKTSEKALQYTAEETCRQLNLDLYDYCVCPYQGKESDRYIFLFELRNCPKNKNLKKIIRDTAEENLRKANPVYGESIDDGSLKPMTIELLQEETFLLYRDLMLLKGKSAAQLKPIHVTESPFQQKFFLGLVDKDFN